MDNSKKRPGTVWSMAWVVAFLGIFLFLNFYRADGNLSIATSPYSATEVEVVMNATEHIRFVEELGITPSGKTLFSYRWVDYGIFDAFTCFDEDDAVSDELGIVDVKR